MLAVHLLLAGALAVVLRDRARRHAAERHLPALAFAAAALVPALAAALDHRVPVAWLTSLREGTSWNHAEVATATSFQQSPGMESFWLEVLPVTRDLGGVVAANLALQAAALLLLPFALHRLAGPWAALLLTAALAASPTTHATALSETGGPLTQLLLLLALPGAATLREPGAPGRRVAALSLVLVAAALAPVRLELIVFPLAGLVVLPGFDARLRAWADRLPVLPTALVAAALAATCALALPVLRVEGTPSPHLDVLLTALQPTNPTWGALPLELLRHLPAGAALLAIAGAVGALDTRRGLAGPLLFALGALYRAEAHDAFLFGPHSASGWELLRYAPHLLVPALLLAATAWDRLPRRARLVLAPLCLLPPWGHTLLRPVEAAHPHGLDLPWSGAVAQDQQREVRALVQRMRAAPACGILLRARPWGPARADLAWIALRPEDGRHRFVRHRGDPSADPATAAAELLPGVPCVAVWRSLDCQPDRCPGLDALPPEQLWTWDSRPFVHPDHGVAWPREVTVGWLTLAPPSSG